MAKLVGKLTNLSISTDQGETWQELPTSSATFEADQKPEVDPTPYQEAPESLEWEVSFTLPTNQGNPLRRLFQRLLAYRWN